MRSSTVALLLLSIVVTSICGCSTGGPGAETDAIVENPHAVDLRTYEVPAGKRDDLTYTLRYALGGDSPVGRVTTGPGNTVVVTAPASVHEGVRRLLDDLDALEAGSEASETNPASISYWFVVGRPLEAAEARSGPVRTTGRLSLAPIESVLQTIAQAQGPQEFRLLEHLRLASLGSDRALVQGKHGKVVQRASIAAGQVVADVNIALAGNSLESRVVLTPGKYLVLGQAVYAGRPFFAFGPDWEAETTLYYVMTCEL